MAAWIVLRKKSYRYWKDKPTSEIQESLRNGLPDRPGEKGGVNGEGRITQGNTRALILRDRGVPWNEIPLQQTSGGLKGLLEKFGKPRLR